MSTINGPSGLTIKPQPRARALKVRHRRHGQTQTGIVELRIGRSGEAALFELQEKLSELSGLAVTRGLILKRALDIYANYVRGFPKAPEDAEYEKLMLTAVANHGLD